MEHHAILMIVRKRYISRLVDNGPVTQSNELLRLRENLKSEKSSTVSWVLQESLPCVTVNHSLYIIEKDCQRLLNDRHVA